MASFLATSLVLALVAAGILQSLSMSMRDAPEEKDTGLKRASAVRPPTSYPGTKEPFTKAEKKYLINQHRAARKNPGKAGKPGAADMEYLKWDKKLADLSMQWSSACLWEHSEGRLVNTAPFTQKTRTPSTDLGENIAYSTVSDKLEFLEGAWYGWHDEEKEWYTYSANSCSGKACGHYTQIVWAKTTKVGCGMAFCPSLYKNGRLEARNAYMMTCVFNPPGNYGGRPYKEGAACSQCSSGKGWCSDNFCRDCAADGKTDCGCGAVCQHCGTLNQDTCTCSCYKGWQGPACSDQCSLETDHSDHNCPMDNPEHYCQNYAWVLEKCTALCGGCDMLKPGDKLCDT